MTLTTRLDRIAAALGGDGEPGILFVYVAAADGVPRTGAGEEVDLNRIDPRTTQVLLYVEVPARSRQAAATTHPER